MCTLIRYLCTMLLCLIWWNRNESKSLRKFSAKRFFKLEISPLITWPRRCRELATRWHYNVQIDNLHFKERLARIFFEILKKDFKLFCLKFWRKILKYFVDEICWFACLFSAPRFGIVCQNRNWFFWSPANFVPTILGIRLGK